MLALPGSRLVLSPSTLTLVGLIVGLGAGVAASQQWWLPALAAFALNRLLDGLDGAVARSRGQASDRGAYLDMMADAVVYVTIPLGLAIGHDRNEVWVATAVLLGTFTINMISWSHLSALLERRGAGASSTGELTSVTMPPGLVEGTETMFAFGLFLIAPDWIVGSMTVMAVAVAAGAGIRTVQGAALLRRVPVERTSIDV